jgi:hypothetical protein
LLITPPGIYALGFLIGFIWGKLKQVVPKLTFSIDGILELFKGVYGSLVDLYFEISDNFNEFIKEHPKLQNFIDRTTNIIDEFKNKTFGEIFKTTKLYTIYKRLEKLGVINILKGVYDIAKGYFKWIIDHPKISAMLYGGASVIKEASTLLNMAKMISLPLRGGIISGIIALACGFATQTVTTGVISMFDGTADMKNATWALR